MNLENSGVTAIANKNAIELKLKILINSSVAMTILYHIPQKLKGITTHYHAF